MEQGLFSDQEPKQLTIPGLYYQPSMFEEHRRDEAKKSEDQARRRVIDALIDDALKTELFTSDFSRTRPE